MPLITKKELANFIAPFPDNTPVIVQGTRHVSQGKTTLGLEYLPPTESMDAHIALKFKPVENKDG